MNSSSPESKKGDTPPALILVVDDDQTILETVLDLLNQEGYTTLSATSGLHALQVLQTRAPDLIISDVMMPDIDGFEFYNRVRLNPAWALIPFIFLTARGQPTDIRQGIGLGADAYVIKPFTREDLLTAVQSRLKRMQQIERATHGNLERMEQVVLEMLSHELRTPLTYIYGFVSLLDDHATMDPAEIDRMVTNIRVGAERLIRLVEDSILIARIESGELKAEIKHYRRPTELAPLIHEVVRDKSVMAEQHQVIVELKIPDEMMLLCIPAYVQDALARLLDNAIKFSRPGGGHVWISAENQPDRCLISVRDDGIGIHPDQHRLLFERFRQIDRQHLEQQGTGLGLAIAKGILEQHGGGIDAESDSVAGQRTTFTLWLPATE